MPATLGSFRRGGNASAPALEQRGHGRGRATRDLAIVWQNLVGNRTGSPRKMRYNRRKGGGMAILRSPTALSAWRALLLASIVISSIGFAAAPVDAATADEEPENASDADQSVTAEVIGRVHIAAPVGRVSLGIATAEGGRPIYATRSLVAGSASVVSLSAVQPLSARSSAGLTAGPIRTASSVVTSNFGAMRLTAQGGVRAHAGIDLAAPAGSPVAAAYDGRVLSADWAGSYGLLVVLDHGDGLQTRYAHLSRLMVASGQQVRQGDLIGLVGSTGRSTGPHLHYELRRNGIPVNPLAH